MDIQLNITTSADDRKKKKKIAPSGYNFVSKPNAVSKTIAKPKKNLNKNRKINLPSLIKTTDTFRVSSVREANTQLNVSEKQEKRNDKSDRFQNLSKIPDASIGDLQMNLVAKPAKKFKRTEISEKPQETEVQPQIHDSEDWQTNPKQQRRFSRWDGSGDHKDQRSETFRKSNKVSVASLFKNNPDIPTLGQRAVLPLSEKLYSGEHFADLDIHSHQVANLEQNLHMKELTTVQQRVTPVILQGRDTLVRSQTGSGKTLAYALPIIEALQAIRPKINRASGIKVLVIVPTRELATQTYELFVKLVKPFIWIVCGVLSGGQRRKAEKAHLRKGITVLVATPGRLRDHLKNTKSLQFENVRCLVLDEADLLLDMGYEKDVSAVVKAIEDHQRNAQYKPLDIIRQNLGRPDPRSLENQNSDEDVKHPLTKVFKSDQRQTILLSATLTKAVEKLAGLTMAEPVFVDALEGREPLIADSLTALPVKKKVDNIVETVKEEIETKATQEELSNIASEESDDANSTSSDNDDEEDEDEVLGLKSWNGFNQRGILDLANAPETGESSKNKAEKSKKKQKLVQEKSGSSDDSDSGSDDSNDEEVLGLQTWNGFIQRDLFDLPKAEPKIKGDSEIYSKSEIPKVKQKQKLEDKSRKKTAVRNSQSNSDSDSDYEFFREQKKTADEESLKVKKEDNDDEDETAETVENSFRNAIQQAIDEQDLIIPESVEQAFMVIPMKLRLVTLASMIVDECLIRHKNGKILVFMATQELVDFHCHLLETVLTSPKDEEDEDTDLVIPVNLSFFQLHGNMEHPTRIRVFNEFRKAKSGVLICTDVAARGLDLPFVDTVIQYTIPSSIAGYVHRVGRTGRAGRPGRAVLILLPEEVPLLTELADRRIRIKQEESESVLPVLSQKSNNKNMSTNTSYCTQADRERAASLHNIFENLVSSNETWSKAASKAFASWSRQYRTYPRTIRSLVGKLHLGHACRSLAIRDAPKEAASKAKAAIETQEEKKLSGRLHFEEPVVAAAKHTSKKQFKKTLINFPTPRRPVVSEFDSGLEPIQKKRKFMS